MAAAELLVVGVDLPELDPPTRWVVLPESTRMSRRFDAPAPAPPPAARAPSLGVVRWVPLAAGGGRPTGSWLVLGDRGGVGDRVGAGLPGARLLQGAQPLTGAYDAILDLRGLDLEPNPAAWRARVEQLRQLARHLAGQPSRLWVATRCGQGVLPGDPVDPGQAMAWGLLRTLAVELPAADPTLLDLGPIGAEPAAAALLAALGARDDRERQIAVRAGRRYVARWGTGPSGAGPAIRADRAYLIAGGTGALGGHLAEWLGSRGAGSVWRVGRRSGVDAADPVAVARLLAEIDAAGIPLGGVFALSAVLSDGLLASQDASAVDAVLRAKVDVAWNLHEATRGRPLDLFVCYGSAASVLPSVGQAIYAAGNAFLDGLAAHRRALGLPGVSLGWGPWAELGLAHAMGPAHRARQEATGIRFHRPSAAIAALEAGLGAVAPAVVLAEVDWPVHLASLGEMSPFYATVAAPREDGPLVAVAPRDRPVAALSWLEEALREVIGRPADRPLDVDAPLPELGVDSLLAVRLHARMAEAGFAIPIGRVLAGPSLRELAALVAVRPAENSVDAPAAPPSPVLALAVSAGLGLLAGILLMVVLAAAFRPTTGVPPPLPPPPPVAPP